MAPLESAYALPKLIKHSPWNPQKRAQKLQKRSPLKSASWLKTLCYLLGQEPQVIEDVSKISKQAEGPVASSLHSVVDLPRSELPALDEASSSNGKPYLVASSVRLSLFSLVKLVVPVASSNGKPHFVAPSSSFPSSRLSNRLFALLPRTENLTLLLPRAPSLFSLVKLVVRVASSNRKAHPVASSSFIL